MWPSGLRRNFAKVERAKALRRFESCHFRMDTVEETLVDTVNLLERTVKAAELTQTNHGVIIVDQAGNFLEHIDFRRDPEPWREKLAEAQKRLDTYRKGLV